jgi:autotransporter-associated beta strand protein
MKRSKKMIMAAATVAVAQFGFATGSKAAIITWDGGGANDNLTNAVNWATDVAPVPADSVIFTGAVRNNPIVDAAVQYTNITFTGSNSFTIGTVGSTTNAITVGASPTFAGVIRNTSTVSQSFSGPVAAYGGTVAADTAPLIFNGSFNLGNNGTAAANSMTLTGANAITLNGGLLGNGGAATGGGSMIKTGVGTLTLVADSSAWAGKVFLQNGTILLSNGNGLGTGGGSLDVSGAATTSTLALTGSVSVSKAIWLQGRSNGAQHLLNVSGNNTLTTVGLTTGGNNQNYQSDAGKLTISALSPAAAVTTARIFTLQGAGDGEITAFTPSVTTVQHTVIKNGAGTWKWGATGTTGQWGAVTVNGGTLVFDGGIGVNAKGAATVNSGGTLQVVSDGSNNGEVGNGVTPTTLTIKSGGALNANTFTDYSLQVGQTLVAGGSISTGGQFSTFGDNRVYIGDVTTASAGTMTVTGNLSLSNQFAAAGGGLYFDLSNSTSGTNDKINASGNVSVSNGPVNIYVNSLGGGFASGTYNLISYNGAALNVSDFNLSVSGGGTTRQALGIGTATNAVNLVVTGAPGNLLWKGNVSGDWDIVGTSNWFNTGTSLADKFYQFDNVSFDDTATTTNVNVTTSVNPGTVSVTTANNYTFSGSGTITSASALTKSGNGTLVVTNTGPNSFASATINAGTLIIGTGGADGWVTNGNVTNNGTLVVNKSSTDTISGLISGTGAVVKDGSGTLVLSGDNTYTGSTTISNGTLQLGAGGTTGSIVSTSVPDNGILSFNHSDNVTFGATVSGTGGLTKAGGGVLQLTATNTYSGPTVINGGALQADEGVGLPTASNLTLNGGTLYTNAASLTRNLGTGAGEIQLIGGFSGFSARGANLTVTINNGGLPLPWGSATFNPTQLLLNDPTATANIAFTSDIDMGGAAREIKVDAQTGTVSGVISNGTLRVNGFGTLVLTAVNTFGNSVIDDGGAGPATVRAMTSGALGTGSVALGSLGNATTARIELANGITLANPITFFGRNNDSVAIENLSGNNTLSGLITLAAGGNREWVQSDGGILVLSGSDPAAAGVAITSASNMPDNSGRVVTLRGASNGVVSGKIQNGVDPNTLLPTFVVGVNKDGAGAWTLSGNNTYTGATSVNAGTLAITQTSRTSSSLTVVDGAKAIMTARTGGGAKVLQVNTLNLSASGTLDLNDNDLVVNNGVFSDIQAKVFSGYGTTPDTNLTGITSTTGQNTGGVAILALFNNALFGVPDYPFGSGQTIGANAIVGKYTYIGDTDWNGEVNAQDYTAVDANLGTTGLDLGAAWFSGDTNFDGNIDPNDYTGIDAALGLGAGNPLSAQGLTAVPEPASIGLLGVGLLLARRRRLR